MLYEAGFSENLDLESLKNLWLVNMYLDLKIPFEMNLFQNPEMQERLQIIIECLPTPSLERELLEELRTYLFPQKEAQENSINIADEEG